MSGLGIWKGELNIWLIESNKGYILFSLYFDSRFSFFNYNHNPLSSIFIFRNKKNNL